MKGWTSPFAQQSSFQGQGRKLGGGEGSSGGAGGTRPLGVPRTGAAAGRALHETAERQEQLQKQQKEEWRQQMHQRWAGAGAGPPTAQEQGPGKAQQAREQQQPQQLRSTGFAGGGGSVHHAAAVVLSASPPGATLDILTRILRNIVTDPGNPKFKRIRLGNPRIADTVGKAAGAMDLLRSVGFEMVDEAVEGGAAGGSAVAGGVERWAVMTDVRLELVSEAVAVLSAVGGQSSAPAAPAAATAVGSGAGVAGGSAGATPAAAAPVSAASAEGGEQEAMAPMPRIDRQVRVFLSTEENKAARIEVPDSFFDRTAEDVRQEAMARRRAQEGAQLLMTRAMRERQAAALKRRYRAAIVRVMFPDGLVLQGVFRPSEPTAALYEDAWISGGRRRDDLAR
ncbi:unnamed protein product [Closterium sp. NIES-65]|nr:unnamed protein product [Closterium sp. NIES-65]